jgi:hypothetical protein
MGLRSRPWRKTFSVRLLNALGVQPRTPFRSACLQHFSAVPGSIAGAEAMGASPLEAARFEGLFHELRLHAKDPLGVNQYSSSRVPTSPMRRSRIKRRKGGGPLLRERERRSPSLE